MISRLSQEQFKDQEKDSREVSSFKFSRIKNQEQSRSRFKTQDSRIKKRLNQDKYKFFFSKHWVAYEVFTKAFTKEFLLSGNRLSVAKIVFKKAFNWIYNVPIDFKMV